MNEFIESSCLPPEYTMTYAVGKRHAHHTHKISLHGGVYLCMSCGATAAKKLVKLARPCFRPTSHGKYNREAYISGRAPAGFPDWPYKQIYLREDVIVNNVQFQTDQLHRQTMRQTYVPPRPIGVDEDIDTEEFDQYGQPPNIEEPYQGSSSSDSD